MTMEEVKRSIDPTFRPKGFKHPPCRCYPSIPSCVPHRGTHHDDHIHRPDIDRISYELPRKHERDYFVNRVSRSDRKRERETARAFLWQLENRCSLCCVCTLV